MGPPEKRFKFLKYKVVFILYLQYEIHASHAHSTINVFLLPYLEQATCGSFTYVINNCPGHMALVCIRTINFQENREIHPCLK